MITPQIGMAALNVAANLWSARQQTRQVQRQAGLIEQGFTSDMLAFSDRAHQIRRHQRGKIGIRALQMSEEVGRLQAAISSSGLSGNSMARMMAVSAQRAGQDIAAINDDAADSLQQTGREVTARFNQATGQLAGMPRTSSAQLFATIASQLFSAAPRNPAPAGRWTPGSDLS